MAWRIGILLPVVGTMLMIFGVVWMTTIFPNQKKIPSGFSGVVEYEGSYDLTPKLVSLASRVQP